MLFKFRLVADNDATNEKETPISCALEVESTGVTKRLSQTRILSFILYLVTI
jgi:hypothetical protein